MVELLLSSWLHNLILSRRNYGEFVVCRAFNLMTHSSTENEHMSVGNYLYSIVLSESEGGLIDLLYF